jgi:Ser/Thr protein kinase RdoA (MazF antagonist)
MDRCARPLTGQLRDLALAALAGQGVAVRRLRWMGQHTNHLFRCDTAAGERLVIRVCLPGQHRRPVHVDQLARAGVLGGVRFAERRELLVASREPHHDVTVHRV